MKMRLAEIKNTDPMRDHGSIEDLKRSIAEVGLLNPLTINQDFELLAGRRRYQAVIELGWTEVECRVVNTNGLITLDLDKIENKCEICGYPFADQHHILPKQYGGTDEKGNFIYLCANHHRAIYFLIQLDIAMEKNEASLMSKNGLVIQSYLILNDQLVYRFYGDFLRGKLIYEVSRTKNP